MTLVGGMGTVLGPFAGAAIIVTMQNYLKGWGEVGPRDPGLHLRHHGDVVPARCRRRNRSTGD